MCWDQEAIPAAAARVRQKHCPRRYPQRHPELDLQSKSKRTMNQVAAWKMTAQVVQHTALPNVPLPSQIHHRRVQRIRARTVLSASRVQPAMGKVPMLPN